MSQPVGHLSWFDKILLLLAGGAGIALFLSVGWMALAPDDPRGAVSLLTSGRPLLMAIQGVALAAVAALVATLLIGGKLPDAGVFAAALGMALATLQGDTAGYLLINISRGHRSLERVLAAKLAVETIVWFAAILAAMVLSGLVVRWCGGSGRESESDGESAGRGNPNRPVTLADLAVSECPLLGERWTGSADRARLLDGLKILGLTTFVALVIFPLVASGSAPRSVQHGQVCFAAWAAFYAGTWVSRQFAIPRTAFWGLLAVPLAGVLGFVWTLFQGGGGADYHPANVPFSAYLRALPLTYVAVGTLGVLTAHWTVADRVPTPRPAREERDRRSRRR